MSIRDILTHPALISFLLRQDADQNEQGNPAEGGGSDQQPNGNSNENGGTTLVVVIILAIVLSIALAIFVFVFVRVFYHRRHLRPEYVSDPLQQFHLHPILNEAPQPPALVRRQRLANLPGLTLTELSQVAPVSSFTPPPADPPTCPICLDDILPQSKVRTLPCNHTFHAQCIEEWASKANRCPVCNTPIIPDEQLHKTRLSAIEQPDPASVPSTTIIRQRRRRTRNDNGVFQLSTTPPPTPLQPSPLLLISDRPAHHQ
eukprot:GFKZ01013085.1.p1 GENE.GFKZ01013085.1~~GFKZ01013085.1.p1  ORF type:complete len:259 (+),score=28.98 GFKZ01013085.1:474-1250(+)